MSFPLRRFRSPGPLWAAISVLNRAPHKGVGLLLCTLISSAHAQVKIDIIQILTDSARTALTDTTRAALVDTLAGDSTHVQAPKPLQYFRMPSAAFALTPEQREEYLFQDLTQLLAYELPVLPLVTGEVGWPRYVASAELPARVVATSIDSVWWIPGVYGNVDFTSIPEASFMTSSLASTSDWLLSSHGAAGNFSLASDSIDFAQPLSSAEYSKGPYGADAVRVNFSRAFSKRITGALHATFSNNDGQFVDLPYEGHKAMGKFDYRLSPRARLRYRHFNTRNEAGIGVPFFLEEQPELTNARHKEERLYHGLEWERAHAITVRFFSWQIKEELFDPARLVRHRLRDWGGEFIWQRQRERSALAAHVRLGKEEIHSTSILARSRFYQELALQAALRVHARFWLQSAGQMRFKKDWPTGYSAAISGLYQSDEHKQLWAKFGVYQIPPALAERDNELPTLARNENLQAVRLAHAQLGGRLQLSNVAAQFALGNAMWQHSLNYSTTLDTTAFPEFGDSVQVVSASRLQNLNETRQHLGAQMSLQWRPLPQLLTSMHGAFAQPEAAQAFWFWHQPESYVRATLSTRMLMFEKTIEVMPRFAVNYLGERRAPIFSASSGAPSFQSLPSAVTLDFQLRILYGTGALFFSWENLLDERFDLREGVPHPGRLFRWGFWWKFLN